MRIAVIGYSGAGKSTLSEELGRRYGIPVLHLDRVQFTSNWGERDRGEAHAMVAEFMERPDWVIDGNYNNFDQQRRLVLADQVLFLNVSRLTCLGRVWRRYRRFRGGTRPDMSDGCIEKLDAEFLWWVLWKGRAGDRRRHYRDIVREYPEKTVELRGRRALDRYLEGLTC